MKRIAVLVSLVVVFALAAPALAGPFTDVPESHWAYDALKKVSSAGIITGYPDGTFKGQKTLTRYEIAVVVSRVLDQVAEERKELAERVDALEGGLTAGQAEDTIAIFKSLIRQHKEDLQPQVVESEGLTEKEAEEVAGIVEALVMEFKFELEDINANIAALGDRVDNLEERVATVEENQDNVTFSGSYAVDFEGVNTTGDALVADEGEEYYYVNPFDAQSGWYESDEDADSTNWDGSQDYRLTDEGDYYEAAEPSLSNTVELNAAITKGILEADLTMTAMANEFGKASDDTAFDLDSISGTITTPEFTATIADEQAVAFKDYLFDDVTDLNGVVVTEGDNTYFIGKTVEEIVETKDINGDGDYIDANEYNFYEGIEPGGADPHNYVERDHLLIGAERNVEFILPFKVLVGYEYARDGEFTRFDSDGNDVGTFSDVTEVRKSFVGFENASNLYGFDLTTEFGLNLGENAPDSNHLLRLGAEGSLGMFDIVANMENTQNMDFIQDYAYAYKKGYDVEASTSVSIFDITGYRESYDTSDDDSNETTVSNTITVSIPEEKLNVAGFDIDGKVEMTRETGDAMKDVRDLNVSKELGKLALAYNYDLVADNENYDPEYDQVDNGIIQDEDKAEDDADDNTHLFTADYNFTDALTAGVDVEMSKAVANDSGKKVEWKDEFTNTTTLTGRYTGEIVEAGFEKVLEGDLVLDGKVTAPTTTILGTDFDAEASLALNIDAEANNYMASVKANRPVNDKLNLDASYLYEVKEYDADFAGTMQEAKAGLEYTITEDVKATADFMHMSFDELDTDREYSVDQATAGVSFEF